MSDRREARKTTKTMRENVVPKKHQAEYALNYHTYTNEQNG